MFGITSFAETSFSTLGKIGGIVLASAQIDADATVTANANAIKPFSAAIKSPLVVTVDLGTAAFAVDTPVLKYVRSSEVRT